MWEILSEVQPVLSRFPAYSFVEVTDDADEIISRHGTGTKTRFTSVIDSSCCPYNAFARLCLPQQFDDSPTTQRDTFEFPAVRTGPIHVHDQTEVHWRSVTLWRLLRLHWLFGRAELLWLITLTTFYLKFDSFVAKCLAFLLIQPNFDFITSLYPTDDGEWLRYQNRVLLFDPISIVVVVWTWTCKNPKL